MIIPILTLMYLFSSLDKSNFANARVMGMMSDLGGDPNGEAYALASSLFSVGYAPLSEPRQFFGLTTSVAPGAVWEEDATQYDHRRGRHGLGYIFDMHGRHHEFCGCVCLSPFHRIRRGGICANHSVLHGKILYKESASHTRRHVDGRRAARVSTPRIIFSGMF